ncbi:prostaglandin-endoperoxide synthase 2 [Streptosporangium becharense]|uniref:Prostaglandin-endoperoxide synthase 2 n=1 Tax=Streptosporangium becharense TaxID=1816182 RepID=A0A7W9IHB0_9ACTN|nr:peroxidase family protein [Streptosporangium becharense]MBB2912468.1 prostaglandin-endoperoxide synthase 2 [Streptosporangium becharense]MBB5820702.1 prostaglandin-endoperoxide synthase 2 [Streptosporangium becharense]
MATGRVKARSIATDGAVNRLRFLALTGGRPFWDLAQAIRPVRRRLNASLIDHAIREMPPRPEPLSTMADYTSWASLTDRTYSGRHMPPVAPATYAEGSRPTPERAADLFTRGESMIPCPRSTVLFAYFAQWFTDGFLRGDTGVPRDPRKNSSNHHIDLNQVYGLREEATAALRAFDGGLLKSQSIDGGEFPPHLCENGKIKPEFAPLSVVRFAELTDAQRDTLFATGSDRGNIQIGFTMLTVLFLREHNRVARLLARHHPRWDDERLFQTTRNILIVLLIKLVVEEYINHITPYHFRFTLDPRLPAMLARAPWHRENWASVEFNLVYRWHSLIPSRLSVGGRDLPMAQTLIGGVLIPGPGLGRLFEDASRQRAGRIGLFNTDPLLREVDVAGITDSRTLGLASYNDYREHCRFPRVRAFEQVTGDERVSGALRELYRGVDDLDLYVGLFAEEPGAPGAILPPLLTKIIAIDAFSQALTNPLLAPRVFNAATFSPHGMRIIATTRTLSDVLHRNTPEDPRHRFVSMTRRAEP